MLKEVHKWQRINKGNDGRVNSVKDKERQRKTKKDKERQKVKLSISQRKDKGSDDIE